MRLSANVITKGRYYKAGEEIPDDLLSDALRKYAVDDSYPVTLQADNMNQSLCLANLETDRHHSSNARIALCWRQRLI
jgi:hypothetical protein